ncbi:hypothetical protein RB594_003366 [Gaeumannomyces avenae]
MAFDPAASAGAAFLPAPESKEGAQGISRLSTRSDDIYEAALVCRHLFEEHLKESRLYSKQVAELQRRFVTWAGFLGVFAPVSACLDTRLANAPEMKELVISMLTVLRRNLERGIKHHHVITQEESSVEASAEIDVAIIGISGSIDRLSRLALVIRTASKPDHVEKVLRFSRRQESDGFDKVIFALIKWRFPIDNMAESLQVQLASSIAYRRSRLLYNFKHEMKLSADRNDGTDTETTPTEAPDTWRATLAAIPGQRKAGQPPQPRHPTTKAAATAAGPAHPTQSLRDDGVKSDASSSRSNNPFTVARYPEPPTVPPGHSDAQCTICCKPQQRRILTDKKRWRMHVDEDLEPYICISEQCGNLPPAFSTREDWRKHMRSKHRADWAQYMHRPHRWLCTIKHSPPRPFESEQLLLDHLRKEHSEDFPEAELVLIASRSKVPVPSEAYICQFCGEDVAATLGAGSAGGSKSTEKPVTKSEGFGSHTDTLEPSGLQNDPSPTACGTPPSPSGASHDVKATLAFHKKDVLAIRMWKHIADHLESMALWSLRWWDDDSRAFAETSGGDSSISSVAALGDPEKEEKSHRVTKSRPDGLPGSDSHQSNPDGGDFRRDKFDLPAAIFGNTSAGHPLPQGSESGPEDPRIGEATNILYKGILESKIMENRRAKDPILTSLQEQQFKALVLEPLRPFSDLCCRPYPKTLRKPVTTKVIAVSMDSLRVAYLTETTMDIINIQPDSPVAEAPDSPPYPLKLLEKEGFERKWMGLAVGKHHIAIYGFENPKGILSGFMKPATRSPLLLVLPLPQHPHHLPAQGAWVEIGSGTQAIQHFDYHKRVSVSPKGLVALIPDHAREVLVFDVNNPAREALRLEPDQPRRPGLEDVAFSEDGLYLYASGVGAACTLFAYANESAQDGGDAAMLVQTGGAAWPLTDVTVRGFDSGTLAVPDCGGEGCLVATKDLTKLFGSPPALGGGGGSTSSSTSSRIRISTSSRATSLRGPDSALQPLVLPAASRRRLRALCGHGGRLLTVDKDGQVHEYPVVRPQDGSAGPLQLGKGRAICSFDKRPKPGARLGAYWYRDAGLGLVVLCHVDGAVEVFKFTQP